MNLGLGTAQFGMHYGISNSQGQPDSTVVERILDVAADNSISVLDTAPAYGNSQTVLGRCLTSGHEFRLVSKTPHFPTDMPTRERVALLQKTFAQTLQQLGVSRIYGLLIHNADDLLHNSGPALFACMQAIKDAGQVGKIGVSAYRPAQLEEICSKYAVDLVQVPVNLLDQRFLANNLLHKLRDQGIEIHTRSAFLQGLLLMPTSTLPAHLRPLQAPLNQFRQAMEEHGLSPLQAALAFLAPITEIDSVIVGTNSVEELSEIVIAAQAAPFEREWSAQFAVTDEALINPALWPSVMEDKV